MDDSGTVSFPNLHSEEFYETVDEADSLHIDHSYQTDVSNSNGANMELMNQMKSFVNDAKTQFREIQSNMSEMMKNQLSEFEKDMNNIRRKHTSVFYDNSDLNTQSLAHQSHRHSPQLNFSESNSSFVVDHGVDQNTNRYRTHETLNSSPHCARVQNYEPEVNFGSHTNHSTGRQNTTVKSVQLKPQSYDGSDDLEDYLTQFQILSEINNWSYSVKSLYLAGSLKGAARALLSELSPAQQRDYDCLVRALNSRYGSVNKAEVFRAQLQNRTKGKNETIPDLAQSIKKLTRQAYPLAPPSVIEVLSLDHFIDAINDSDIRLRLREACPRSINEAETLAVRLETYRLADNHRGRQTRSVDVRATETSNVSSKTSAENNEVSSKTPSNSSEIDSLKNELKSLTKEIKDLVKTTKSSSQNNQNKQKQYTNNNGNQQRHNWNRNSGNNNYHNNSGNKYNNHHKNQQSNSGN
ncbi:probable basic-leucine zipper transcription factor E [Argopecten irradians]|uniref:probable basic-leucine zipper transcription factor E n=1 Tax=Argopecten irradians TaxID=31199 RepID=UPI0037131FFE